MAYDPASAYLWEPLITKPPGWPVLTVALPAEVEPSPQSITVARADGGIEVSSVITVPIASEKYTSAASVIFVQVAPVSSAATAGRTRVKAEMERALATLARSRHKAMRYGIDLERIAALQNDLSPACHGMPLSTRALPDVMAKP